LDYRRREKAQEEKEWREEQERKRLWRLEEKHGEGGGRSTGQTTKNKNTQQEQKEDEGPSSNQNKQNKKKPGKQGIQSNRHGAPGNDDDEEEEEEDAVNPDPLGRRVLRREKYCSWFKLAHLFLFLVAFATPLVSAFVGFSAAPAGFFSSSLTSDAARLLLLCFAVLPPYLFVLVTGLNWTLVLRTPTVSQLSGKGQSMYMDNVHKSGRQTSGQSKNMFSNERVWWYEGLWGPPNAVEYPRYGTIRSLKEGRKRQQALDEEFSSKLRWPRWFLYHYPKWSIGHGLMTTGERRRLVTFYDYQVHYGRCLVLLVLYVMVPICVLLPLSFTGVVVDLDPTNIVAVNVIFIFAFGYPVGYFLFYVSRAVWSIVPKAVRACIPIVCVHFFVFLVIPLGGIYPVYSSRKLFFHSDVALFCEFFRFFCFFCFFCPMYRPID